MRGSVFGGWDSDPTNGHEALLPIKKAISDGDYRFALERCNEMIVQGSRYAGDCLKMKGQLHFLLKQLKEAQHVYESVLGKKPVVWGARF